MQSTKSFQTHPHTLEPCISPCTPNPPDITTAPVIPNSKEEYEEMKEGISTLPIFMSLII